MATVKSLKFAPRETFEQILEWSVIPTFDLIIEVTPDTVLIARRKIAPYANTWALPGLRMFKPESIEDTLRRIASQEVGLQIDVKNRRLLDQFVGRFTTEHHRQDLSSCYVVQAKNMEITLNSDHFTTYRLIRSFTEIPPKTGAMYRSYLEKYFAEAGKIR